MRRPSIVMGLLVIGLTVLGCASMAFGQSDAGWTTLIDGATGLDNWNRIGDANWRAEDGAIVADKGKGGGPFALQFGNGPNDATGGVIKWRKVQIKPL